MGEHRYPSLYNNRFSFIRHPLFNCSDLLDILSMRLPRKHAQAPINLFTSIVPPAMHYGLFYQKSTACSATHIEHTKACAVELVSRISLISSYHLDHTTNQPQTKVMTPQVVVSVSSIRLVYCDPKDETRSTSPAQHQVRGFRRQEWAATKAVRSWPHTYPESNTRRR